MTTTELLSRIDHLLEKGSALLATRRSSEWASDFVDTGKYAGFTTASLSFISSLFGEKHPYYTSFKSLVHDSTYSCAECGVSILHSIKHEVEQGWLTSLKQLVTAEVFSDFLEMGEYLLKEKYKDPAAVIIGSVLEEHLRQLCKNHSVDIYYIKEGNEIPKKASILNSDLTKAEVYGILEQKNVTAWLDLRNRAAHGKYDEYVISQVELMYQGVLDFIARIK